MRFATMASALLVMAAPVSGQAHQHKETVSGGGQLPAGWHARRDRMAAGAQLDNVRFMAMGANGFHATMGGTNAIFWNPKHDAKGEFELAATFVQSKPNAEHPEGAGLVFNGANLDQDNQSYVYFLVRDGKYLINHRAGADVHKIVTWTDHPAIKKADASGKTSNRLGIRVAGEDVQYLVNDQVVHTQKRAYMKPDGVVGFRVNMHLDMHITDFQLKPIK